MEKKAKIEGIYAQSESVVSREIDGELIIIPITCGIGDLDEELYTLNGVGQDIWSRLNGNKPLREIAGDLEKEYESSSDQIKEDVIGFVTELLKRGMVVER